MNNVNFSQYCSKSGETIYAISHATGIPYTTLSELKNNKLNINQCAFDTIARLAAFFNCTPESLVNPTQLMKNISGKYRGIAYRWIVTDDRSELHILDDGLDLVLQKSQKLTQPRFYHAYSATALCLIDIYLEQKEVRKALCRITS